MRVALWITAVIVLGFLGLVASGLLGAPDWQAATGLILLGVGQVSLLVLLDWELRRMERDELQAELDMQQWANRLPNYD